MENGTKFCPHCGNQLSADAKFCPRCGFAMANVSDSVSQPQPEPAPTPVEPVQATPQRTTDPTANPFTWFIESLKHPAEPIVGANPWFGPWLLVIELLITITVIYLIDSESRAFVSSDFDFYDDYVNKIGSKSFLAAFGLGMIIFLFILIHLGLSYGIRRLNDSHAELNFWEFTNHFASISSFSLIISIVAFMTTIFIKVNATHSANYWVPQLLTPLALMFNLSYVYNTIRETEKPRWEKLYVILVSEVLLIVICVGIIYFLVKQHAMPVL